MPRLCSYCHAESPDDARFCFNPECRRSLDPEPAPVVTKAPTRSLPSWVRVALPVSAVGLLTVVGAIVLATRGGESAPPLTLVEVTTTRAPSTTPASTVAPSTTVDPRGIPVPVAKIASAEASSTLPDQDGLSYGIEQTLDAVDNTAWNSDGSSGGGRPDRTDPHVPVHRAGAAHDHPGDQRVRAPFARTGPSPTTTG